MTPRTMRAVLLGVKTNELLRPGWDAVRTARAFLGERFALTASQADQRLTVLTDETAAVSKAQLLAALAAAARALGPGDLLVLLFSGHGSDEAAGAGWLLDEHAAPPDRIFTDQDLGAALAKFERGVELFVVSDCCYGAGILAPAADLPAQIIFASAADPHQGVIASRESRFVRALCAAIPGARSYRELDARLRAANPSIQDVWSVRAASSALLDTAPLRSSVQ